MSDKSSSHAKGLLLTALGGLALTFDIPLIRLADGDPWPTLLLRTGSTVAVTFLVIVALRLAGKLKQPLIPGWKGLIVALLYGATSITFMLAVFHTSTANLVFILALNPMIAALLSWAFLGERPHPFTLLAMIVMLGGVAIIVGDGLSAGHWLGDLLSLCSTLMLASAITLTRASGRDMGFASLVGVAFPLCVALLMVGQTGYRVESPWWIILDGAVVMPVSFYLLAIGPKYIPAPEVALFYLLETVLAPVWVWLIFSEAPSRSSLIGGSILIAALVVHSLWQLLAGRRRRGVGPVRHPA